jgi:hypothetical protein
MGSRDRAFRARVPGLADSGWQTLPLQTNFVAFGGGFQIPQYRRIGNGVIPRGLAGRIASTAVAGFTAGILPVSFRPPSTVMFEQHISGARCRVDINNVGFIICQDQAIAVGGYLSLDGTDFYTD